VFSHSGPAAWNQLSQHIRQLSYLSTFKRERKTILLSHRFSSHLYDVMHLCSWWWWWWWQTTDGWPVP